MKIWHILLIVLFGFYDAKYDFLRVEIQIVLLYHGNVF
jgi:hypothetical protein